MPDAPATRLRAAIVGATGYSGQELIRLLARHPHVTITGASSDACGMLMIHQSSNKGGMSGMHMMEEVQVPASGKVAFAPGGYHLMCEQPKMKIGAKVPVTLHFAGGNSVTVAFEVRGASGK